MTNYSRCVLALLCAGAFACSGPANTPPVDPNGSSGSSGGNASSGGSGSSSGDTSSSGSTSSGSSSGSSGSATSGSSGGSGGRGNSGSLADGGTASKGDGGVVGAGTMTDSGTMTGGGTTLTGMLGSLGSVKPTVSSYVIQNSNETLVYLSSAPLSCSLLAMSTGWLRMVATGAQVVEIVVPSSTVSGMVAVKRFGGAEVNFAAGGGTASSETVAMSGSVTFTSCMAGGPCSGTLMAAYAGGGSIMGSFSATFCPNGYGY